MEITQEQDTLIAPSLPGHRGKVGSSKRHVRNVFVSVVAHGGKWRGLPQRFGNWNTIATRISRGSKAGVRDRIVAKPRQAQIPRLRIAAVSRDLTDSKVHPDGTGAQKMANNRLDSPTADEPANSIGLPRRREQSWHVVYRQAILMMRPMSGDGCSIVAQ